MLAQGGTIARPRQTAQQPTLLQLPAGHNDVGLPLRLTSGVWLGLRGWFGQVSEDLDWIVFLFGPLE